MRKVPHFRLLAALGALMLGSVGANAALTAARPADVSFLAVGPAGLKFEGQTSELAVHDDGTTLSVVVPLGQLVTGIDVRDRHMKERYLETPKYPEAVLTVLRSALQFPAVGAVVSADGRGDLAMHGRKNPVTFHYEAKRNKDYDIAGTMRINMKDFGIEVPSYLGVTVKPEVEIKVRFHVVDGDPRNGRAP